MEEQQKQRLAPDLFAGAGLGLLLGLVVGLSITPVVAGLVGALTSLLAVFLGLDASAATRRLPTVNAVRIGAFGFATVLGIGLGLFARINNPLALDPDLLMSKWEAALPDNPTLARQMMVLERASLAPQAVAYVEGAPATAVETSGPAGARTAVLFSGEGGGFDACNLLRPGTMPAQTTLGRYDRPNAPEIVREMGETLSALPEEELQTGLAVTHALLCRLQDAGVQIVED
jgi:hypothetical protein